MDEVFIKINGTQHCPWRAVDQDNNELDKLKSYSAALAEMGCEIPHDTVRYHNNIAEISRQKNRQLKRQMRQFKSVRQAQLFLSRHGVINSHFGQQ